MYILEKIDRILEAKSIVDLVYDDNEFGIVKKGKYTSVPANLLDKYLDKRKAQNQEGNPDNKDSIQTMIKMAKKNGQVSIQINEAKDRPIDSEHAERNFRLEAEDSKRSEPELSRLYKQTAKIIKAKWGHRNIDITAKEVAKEVTNDYDDDDFGDDINIASDIAEFMNSL